MSHIHEDEKQSQKWMETLLRYIYSKDSSGAVPDILLLSPGSYHLLSPLPPFSPFLPPTWLCSEKLICVDHAKGFPVFWLPVVPVQRGVPADQRRGMNEVQHSSPGSLLLGCLDRCIHPWVTALPKTWPLHILFGNFFFSSLWAWLVTLWLLISLRLLHCPCGSSYTHSFVSKSSL